MASIRKTKIGNSEIAVSLILLLLVIFTGDGLISSRPYLPAIYWRSMDPLVHGLIGTIVLSPLARTRRDLFYFFLASTLIDVDHMVMAKSFYVADMLALPARPFSHSITFSLMVAGLGYFITRRALVFWVILIAMASHVVRDAVTGLTPILYPLEIRSIPYPLYIVIEICLYFLSLLLLKRGILEHPCQHETLLNT